MQFSVQTLHLPVVSRLQEETDLREDFGIAQDFPLSWVQQLFQSLREEFLLIGVVPQRKLVHELALGSEEDLDERVKDHCPAFELFVIVFEGKYREVRGAFQD